MAAESFGRPIHLDVLPNGGVVISIDADYGRVPILAFSTRESFAEFALVVQNLYNEMNLGGHAIHKQTCNHHKSSH